MSMKAAMKKLTMVGMAAVAMLVATGAQAGTGVLDFEGFTITFESSGQWDQAPGIFKTTNTYMTGRYDASTGVFSANGTGVKLNSGDVWFSSSTPTGLASYAGRGNEALDARFSYTIQAKDGWELQYAKASQYDYGNFVQLNGGVTSVGAHADATNIGGRTLPDYSNTGARTDSSTQGLVSGKWETMEQRTVAGNTYRGYKDATYDANGVWTGYVQEYTYIGGQTPLTGMNGSYSQTLSAITNNPRQIAYLDGTGAHAEFNVVAIQNIAPVPEPESYAMMAAGFGAIGLIARRKAKKPA